MYESYAKELPSEPAHAEPQDSSGLLAGLRETDKRIAPRFFYDEYGSQLFEQITQLPEYYPTRTEVGLLMRHGQTIAGVMGQGQVLIEPGAGNCSKVRLLLPSLNPACFVPIDISGEFLFAAARQLQGEFPQILIHPVVNDMGAKIALPPAVEDLPRTVFYPGSTIGNYEPGEALVFLRHLRDIIGARGGLLIGVDLIKDTAVLDAAYNDAQGVTALFNLNILNHVNRLIGSNFDTDQFEHVAFYNEGASRIEMYLESRVEQRVRTPGESFHFAAGERIHTEYSYKYSLESFAGLAARAGLAAERSWVDSEKLFSLQYFRAG